MKIKLLKNNEMVITKEGHDILINRMSELVDYKTKKDRKQLRGEIDRVKQMCNGGEHDFVTLRIDIIIYMKCKKCGMET